jgi:hypothetical protein
MIDDFILDKLHFMAKIRCREFDKEAGLKFIEELKKIPETSDPLISKDTMAALLLFFKYYQPQKDYLFEKLDKKSWQELNYIVNQIFEQIFRILVGSEIASDFWSFNHYNNPDY